MPQQNGVEIGSSYFEPEIIPQPCPLGRAGTGKCPSDFPTSFAEKEVTARVKDVIEVPRPR
jgi:hypothetical protein